MRKQLIVIVLLALLLGACGSNAASTPTPYPDEVSWETAIEILNSGEVVAVAQLHNLEVTIELKDGRSIHTVEPIIDAVFTELDKCGDVCADIMRATE